jgi:hypothetical protein
MQLQFGKRTCKESAADRVKSHNIVSNLYISFCKSIYIQLLQHKRRWTNSLPGTEVIYAQDLNSVHGNGGDCFYNQNFYSVTFCHRKKNTFVQYSSKINIIEEDCAVPGAALIGEDQNKESRKTSCALLSLIGC